MGLGERAPAKLAKIPGLANILVAATTKYGFDQAMRTLMQVMASR